MALTPLKLRLRHGDERVRRNEFVLGVTNCQHRAGRKADDALSNAAKKKVREAEAIAERVRQDVLSVLPDDERQVFLDALTTLVVDRLAEPVVCAHPVRRRAPRA